MHEREFALRLGDFFFLGRGLGKFLPISAQDPALFFAHKDLLHNLVRLYIHKSQVGQNIINLTAPACDHYIHLLLVNSITMAATFWGDYCGDMRFVVALVTGQANKLTLFDPIRQSVHNVDHALKLYFFFGNGSINFRA